jgi:hypothetical protein
MMKKNLIDEQQSIIVKTVVVESYVRTGCLFAAFALIFVSSIN